MNLLLRNVRIIDTTSPHHGQTVDLHLAGDQLRAIGEKLDVQADQTVDLEGACCSPGWVDVGAQVGDPGHEQREDFDSLCRAAQAGGYTTVAVLPNTDPVVDTKGSVAYIRQRTQGKLVSVLPLGALSRNAEGRDLTEMIDMHQAGAPAFTDGVKPVQHGGLLLRALLYVKTFDGLILNRPHDESIAAGGQLHEGVVSTMLGMRGIPSLAEALMAERDLRLLAYTDSRLHLLALSAAETVDLVTAAKATGLRVSASVPALNLLFDHTALEGFDPNFKVLPPLRTADDRTALRHGLASGAIDLILSNHAPYEDDSKVLEFPYADFGATGLETTFAVARTALHDHLSPEQLVDILAHRPRRLLGLAPVSVAPGARAELTFFDPDAEWTVGERDLFSKSKNTPLIGQALRGRVIGVFNNGLWWKK